MVTALMSHDLELNEGFLSILTMTVLVWTRGSLAFLQDHAAYTFFGLNVLLWSQILITSSTSPKHLCFSHKQSALFLKIHLPKQAKSVTLFNLTYSVKLTESNLVMGLNR